MEGLSPEVVMGQRYRAITAQLARTNDFVTSAPGIGCLLCYNKGVMKEELPCHAPSCNPRTRRYPDTINPNLLRIHSENWSHVPARPTTAGTTWEPEESMFPVRCNCGKLACSDMRAKHPSKGPICSCGRYECREAQKSDRKLRRQRIKMRKLREEKIVESSGGDGDGHEEDENRPSEPRGPPLDVEQRPMKRGHGRPRKTERPVDPSAPKRGRGRPRKSSAPAPT